MKQIDAVFFLRKRYLVAFLACLGMICLFLLRTNLSIAIVEMTSNKTVTMQNETIIQKAEFDWDSKTKGFVLSVFFLGYFFGPVGGMLSLKYGGVTIYGLGIAVTAVLTILSPILLRLNFYAYIFGRVIEGIFESFSNAVIADIFARWAPPNERSRLLHCNIAGAFIGASINYPLSGYLAYTYSWEVVFYVTGGASLVWSVIWFICTSNDPLNDRFMSEEERSYFQSFTSPHYNKKNIVYPWKEIFTSKPFWACINEFLCFFWAQSFSLYCLTLYVKDIYDINIQDIGLISAIPVAGCFLGVIVAACFSDYLRSRKIFNKFNIHRGFITIGQLPSVICFIYIGLRDSFVETIVLLSLTRVLGEFAEMSNNVLLIDLFYKYAGLIRGFGVMASGVAYFLNPIVMGFMVEDHNRSSWSMYFFFLSAISIWSLTILYIFGSGELQEWAALDSNEATVENIMDGSEGRTNANKMNDSYLESVQL